MPFARQKSRRRWLPVLATMKTKPVLALGLLLALWLAQGCNPDNLAWKRAQAANTVDAYEEYLKLRPKGGHIESAKLKIEELESLECARSLDIPFYYWRFLKRFPQSPSRDSVASAWERVCQKRHPEFRSVRTARIDVRQDYGEVKSIPFDVEKTAKRFLTYVGLDLLDGNLGQADLVLRIEAKGEALHASYWDEGELRVLYSGATVSGTISFGTRSGFVSSVKFEGRMNPPFSVLKNGSGSPFPTTPSLAPWRFALSQDGSFIDKFFESMLGFFGRDLLIAAQGDPDWDAIQRIRTRILEDQDPGTLASLVTILKTEQITSAARQAMELLGEMKDRRAVEPLISALKGEYSGRVKRILNEIHLREIASITKDQTSNFCRQTAAEALGKIGDLRAVEPLIDALREIELQFAASNALEKITGEEFGPDQEKWRAWWEKNKSAILERR
jgi:hypothetical protein